MKDDFNFELDLEKTFSKRSLFINDVLFREGDTLGDGYIIKSGEIKLYRKKQIVQTLGPGGVIGVYKILFNNKSRSFKAISCKKTEVYVIKEEYLKKLLNDLDPFVRHCFRR